MLMLIQGWLLTTQDKAVLNCHCLTISNTISVLQPLSVGGIVPHLVYSIIVSKINIYYIVIEHFQYLHCHINTVTCPEPHSAFGSVRVSSYRNPAIEGTTITFSCPDGLTLTGSSASTCMRNGEWEPPLKGIGCKGKSIVPKTVMF